MNLRRGRPLIAVVDDDACVRRSMKRLLRAHDMNAVMFSSGRAFIETLDAKPSFAPDCAILDVRMPELSGLEVQSLLASKRPGIVVVVVTGSDQQQLDQALAVGAAAVFQKPFDADALIPTLRWVLGSGKKCKP